MRYIINENNEFCGFDFLDTQGVTIPPKAISCWEKATWKDGKWVYDLLDIPQVELDETCGTESLEVFGQLQWRLPSGGGQRTIPKEKDISILIPCYGKAEWIQETVTSCLNQTLSPYQVKVLLMDEESIALKDTLESLSTLVKCEVHERLNASASRNYLVERCETEYFVLLDADDTLPKNFLKTVYSLPASIVFPDVKEEIEEIPRFGAGSLFSFCGGQNLTILLCKTAWNELGGLDEDLWQGGEDTDFFFRLFQTDWRIQKTYNTYYWYNRNRASLYGTPSFYESHFRNIKKNLPIIRKRLSQWADRTDWFYRFIMDDKNFVDYFTFCHNYKREASVLDLVAKKRFKDLLALYQESRLREPKGIMDKGHWKNYALDCEVLGVLSQETIDSVSLVLREGVEVQGETMYDKLTYLFSNYSCLVEDVSLKDKEKTETETETETETVLNHYVTFELNKECNRDCDYCTQTKGRPYPTYSDDEIFERFKTMLRKAESIAPIHPQIMGGEPTLWSDYLIQKLLDLLKDYPEITVISNHDKKDSLWETDSRVRFYTHICDWKRGDKIKTSAGEWYMIVVCHDDIPYLDVFLRNNRNVAICIDEYIGEDVGKRLTNEDKLELAELEDKYGNDVKHLLARNNNLVLVEPEVCRQKINVWRADCTYMTFCPCCGRYQPLIPCDEWTGQLPNLKYCENCNVINRFD